MWSNWGESAKASLTQALEKTGDALSKAATNAGKAARNKSPEQGPEDATTPPPQGRYAKDESKQEWAVNLSKQQNEIMKNFQTGWSNVVHTTRQSLKTAQEAVEKEQHKLVERMHKARTAYYRRDPSLPLDVVALKDAEVVYITDRLITMSHPALPSNVDKEITGERKLAAIGHLLQRRHDGRYMVWNLSEVDYDVSILEDQVLTFSFPGSPSPPLGLLLKLLVSMESWLKADDRNVAVIHCLTGKGRTSTVLAAFLCWMKEANFSDIYQALDYIAACKQISPDELTIPSQRRYASYFKNMLDGVRPSQPPVRLKRIIMSEAPRYARGPPLLDPSRSSKPNEPEAVQRMGCAPYLQIFKAGKLLFTAPASLHYQQSKDELPFCQVADGSVSFHIDQVIQGDILVRCRHLTAKKQRLSMFRSAFHTGYVPPNVMRLTKSQLDGACNDDRFPDDFFLDLIFERVDAEEAATQLLEGDEDHAAVSAGDKPITQALAGGATTVTASAYDSMLHRDSRFWDVINARRKEQSTDDSPTDPMWGPTVGRRREFKPNEPTESEENKKTEQPRTELETFSIGGEFDFLPEVQEPEPQETPERRPPKKDSLMEALMGALDDSEGHDAAPAANSNEVIIFESSDAGSVHTTQENVTSEIVQPASVQATTGEQSSEPTPSTQPNLEKKESSIHDSTGDDDVSALLADANLNLDEDVDALLAGAGGDDNDLLDFDDTDLEDLESFLSPSK